MKKADKAVALVLESLKQGSGNRGTCKAGCGGSRVWLYTVNGITGCWGCWRKALGSAAPKTCAEAGNTLDGLKRPLGGEAAA